MGERPRRSGKPNHFRIELPRGAFRQRTKPSPLPEPKLGESELVTRMRRFELFRRVPTDEMLAMAQTSNVRVFRAGEYLWRHNQKATHAAFLDSGFVKLARPAQEGIPATYALFGPGDSIGILAIWAGMRYPTDAVALNDGLTVIYVDTRTIQHLSEKSLQLAAAIRDELTQFTAAFITKIEIISAGGVPERLAALMLYLIERYGVDKHGVCSRVPFSITRDELGKVVGARLETVVRVLGHWKRAGWLDTRADGYHVLRMDKLREMLAQPARGDGDGAVAHANRGI